METRGVKFNLKNFCEDYVYAINSKDDDDIKELEQTFTSFVERSETQLVTKVVNYLLKQEDVKTNKKLFIFITKFSK